MASAVLRQSQRLAADSRAKFGQAGHHEGVTPPVDADSLVSNGVLVTGALAAVDAFTPCSALRNHA